MSNVKQWVQKNAILIAGGLIPRCLQRNKAENKLYCMYEQIHT